MDGSGLRERLGALPPIRHWQSGAPLPTRWHLILGLVLPALVLVVNMWRVQSYTVDDAYISFRYAHNLVDGLGLVYNPGQRIEGYTNFAWTILIAAGMALEIDPHYTVKIMGGLAAIGTLAVVYRIEAHARPLTRTPVLSTWLLATSAPFSGYAVLGLETAAFAFLVALGVHRTVLEEERDVRLPWSGLLFAVAGLTRPEAPLFAGLALLSPGRKMLGRRNVLRGAFFVVPVAIHAVWRHAYYGLWVPFTFVAKTGDVRQQYGFGKAYLWDHAMHAGPVVWATIFGIAIAIVSRRPGLRLVAAITVAWGGYILTVGGDWMSFFRFMAPIEPFMFILAGVAMRELLDRRHAAATLGMVLFLTAAFTVRHKNMEEAHRKWLKEERRFWRNAAGQTAAWLLRQPRGVVAIGDIGYVGYKTNYPVLDLLGLVDPVIGSLPGGYTRKLGPGFTKRIYSVMPEYMVFILGGQSCSKPQMPGSKLIYLDPRFKAYELGHNIQVGPGASWCIFKRRDVGSKPGG